MHQLTFTLICAVSVLTLNACTSTQVRGVEHVAWQEEPTELGTVAVGIYLEHAKYERKPEEKEAEVREIVHDIIDGLSNVMVADEEATRNIFTEPTHWQKASEYEMINTAREMAINTLCLMTVDRYAGQLWLLLLPPGWAQHTYVNYRLRLLDVASGRVLADLSRSRRSGGYLSGVGRQRLPRDLHDDLMEVLAMWQQREVNDE